ncbi:MAG TPA: TetR/AcrR family transcriptional regulator [Longimicrobiales bacterium]|nr:TetR/AcrR family transcriptional regulator [Longimicrobiales bacterium]
MKESSKGSRRSIGRGEKVRAAVLAATLEELGGAGYAALTVENVAQRAGVHKTTVYRRWKDRENLVVDALSEQIALEIPIPDTGAIATDLRELARGFVRWATSVSGQAVLAAVLSDALRIPEVVAARRRIFGDRLRRAEQVIRRAVERGELPSDVDPAEVIKAMVAPLYLRLLITGEPLDRASADHAARAALAAARAGVLGRSGDRPAE